jgi:uncharacterized protein (TIGR02001 family)
LAGPVAADDWTVSGTATLTSDYRFRGLTQTNDEPAAQVGVEGVHASGWYVGAWASNVSWLSDLSTPAAPISNSLEIDYYAGWRGTFGERFGVDVGAAGYCYPGDYPDGFNRPYTTELYAALTYAAFAAKYWIAVTDAYGFVDSEGSDYLEANWNPAFGAGWTVNLHVGHQRIDGTDDADYTDWKVGVTKAFGAGWSVAAAYVDTNADDAVYVNPFGEELGESTAVVSVAKSF